MRLSYSNIAWELSDEPAAAEILRAHHLDAVDIAPGKYFADPAATTRQEAVRVRDWWRARDIDVLGMQALLFGTAGLNLFGEPANRLAMLDRLGFICRIAGWMGARKLVFGSPRNRDRSALSDEAAAQIWAPWLLALGRHAAEHGVEVCLEPNPPGYQCNFMTTTAEAAAVVTAVDHPGIRLHLDAGAMAMNGEDPLQQVAEHGRLVAFVHASEPELAPISCNPLIHRPLADAVRESLPHVPVSIEMRAAGLAALSPSIARVNAWYGNRA